MTNVRKFLDISTGHLTVAARAMLDANEGPSSAYPHPDGFGWFLYVCDADVQQDWLDEVDAEKYKCIADCMDWARERDCDYILFDCDADQEDGLPYYED